MSSTTSPDTPSHAVTSPDEHRGAPLATAPVPLAPGLAPLLVLAWLSPAVAVVATTVLELLGTASVPPRTTLGALLAVGWLALALRRRWRGLLLDVGRLLLARLRFAAWLLLTVLALATASGPLGWGLAALVALLAAASALLVWNRDRGRFVMGAGLVLVNLLVLVAVEVFVREVVLPRRSHNRIYITHDPVLGWKLRPGLSIDRRGDESEIIKETVNSLGFRTPEISLEKPPGVQRILFLGDSHTEAYTVSDDETYTRLVEARLDRPDRPVQVVSLGVGGFSTDQELLAYLEYGRSYDPDVVVLQFCTNDVPYNSLGHYWRGPKPQYVRRGERLVLTGVPVPDVRVTGLDGLGLLKDSSLVTLMNSIIRSLGVEREVEEEADREEGWLVTDLLVRDLQQLVEGDGAMLVSFGVLSRKNRAEETRQRYDATLAAHGIPQLPIEHIYEDDYASYWVSGHWNQKGQQAAAAALSEALEPYLASEGDGSAPSAPP